MNTVERIVLNKLRSEINDIIERSSHKNKDRMEHEAMFINSAANRAYNIITALEENDGEEAHKMPKV